MTRFVRNHKRRDEAILCVNNKRKRNKSMTYNESRGQQCYSAKMQIKIQRMACRIRYDKSKYKILYHTTFNNEKKTSKISGTNSGCSIKLSSIGNNNT